MPSSLRDAIPLHQSTTTMQLVLSQEVQIQRHTATQQQSNRNRSLTSTTSKSRSKLRSKSKAKSKAKKKQNEEEETKKKKKKSRRKKKKNWLLVKDADDTNTYYRLVEIRFFIDYHLLFFCIRLSKYLKMPYKLLHHTLCLKLQHTLIKNKERLFVLSRLRLFDELCYMETLLKLWQDYYKIGDRHQLWPVSG